MRRLDAPFVTFPTFRSLRRSVRMLEDLRAARNTLDGPTALSTDGNRAFPIKRPSPELRESGFTRHPGKPRRVTDPIIARDERASLPSGECIIQTQTKQRPEAALAKDGTSRGDPDEFQRQSMRSGAVLRRSSLISMWLAIISRSMARALSLSLSLSLSLAKKMQARKMLVSSLAPAIV